MTFSWKPRVRRRLLAVALVAGALSVAAPVSSAGAAISPFSFLGGAGTPLAFPYGAFGTGSLISGPQTGVATNAGCAENRPSTIGGTGSLTQQACFSVLAFIGPSIGQINSQVGPTIIGSTVLSPVIISGGAVLNTVP